MPNLLNAGMINSGGSINHFASHIVRKAMELGLQDRHLAFVREAYAARLAAMHESLLEHLGDFARWYRPRGGYFVWVELPPETDATGLLPAARQAGTGFQPGPVFSSGDGFANYIRLSFAHYGEDDIRKGVRRLAGVLRPAISPS